MAVAAAVVLKGGGKESATTTAAAPAATALPRLVDLGADKCMPCKMMAPSWRSCVPSTPAASRSIFIDVWKNQAKSQQYGIRVIPTQIFFDADGKELMRHEGFFAKEEILAAWRAHGHDFSSPPES